MIQSFVKEFKPNRTRFFQQQQKVDFT